MTTQPSAWPSKSGSAGKYWKGALRVLRVAAQSCEAGTEQRTCLAVFLQLDSGIGITSEPWHHAGGVSDTGCQPLTLPTSCLGVLKSDQNTQVTMVSG